MFSKQLLAGLGQSVKKMGEAKGWTVVSCCHLQGHRRKGLRDISYSVLWVQGGRVINLNFPRCADIQKRGCIL